jgi:hypothetical protein
MGSGTAHTMRKDSDESNHKILSVRRAQEKLGETISEERASANQMFQGPGHATVHAASTGTSLLAIGSKAQWHPSRHRPS